MSDTLHVIEKRLVFMNQRSAFKERVLSALLKEYIYSTQDFEPYWYEAGTAIYEYAGTSGHFIPGSELLEYGYEKALLVHSDLRKLLYREDEKVDSYFLIYEGGYDMNQRYERDWWLIPQMRILWPHMDSFFADIRLAETVKTMISEGAYLFLLKYDRISPVERRRTLSTCSYFNRIMQLMLTLILEEKWWVNNETFALGEFTAARGGFSAFRYNDEAARSFNLPPEFSVLACGKPVQEGDCYPEYPTDIWLVRREHASGRILGVYTIGINELAEKLRTSSAYDIFPVEGYITILDKYLEKELSSGECVDTGVIVQNFLKYESDYLLSKSMENEPIALQKLRAAIEAGDLASVKLEDLDLSVMSFNCLRRASVKTVADLAALSMEDLLDVDDLPAKCIYEIRGMLKEFGKEWLVLTN